MNHKKIAVSTLFLAGCTTFSPLLGGGASHAPTTESQWSKMEALAGSTEGEIAAGPTRIKGNASYLSHNLRVDTNTCYNLKLYWSFDAAAAVTIGFVPDEVTGQTPNDNLAGRQEKFDTSGSSMSYCADRPGEAVFTVSAITTGGYVNTNELLEYVFVVTQEVETPEQTVSRREDEAARSTAAQQKIDSNVESARQEEERARKNAERHCSGCQAVYLTCLGNGESEFTCVKKFEECTGSLKGSLAQETAGSCRRP